MRYRHLCPECGKLLGNLPCHMRRIHKYSANLSKKVVQIYGLRGSKKETYKAKFKTKCLEPSCHTMVVKLSQHLRTVHKIFPRKKHGKCNKRVLMLDESATIIPAKNLVTCAAETAIPETNCHVNANLLEVADISISEKASPLLEQHDALLELPFFVREEDDERDETHMDHKNHAFPSQAIEAPDESDIYERATSSTSVVTSHGMNKTSGPRTEPSWTTKIKLKCKF